MLETHKAELCWVSNCNLSRKKLNVTEVEILKLISFKWLKFITASKQFKN